MVDEELGRADDDLYLPEGDSVPEGPPPSHLVEAGTIAAVLLALFAADRAIELASHERSRLVLKSVKGIVLYDLRPALAILAILFFVLLLLAPRFSRIVAPPGPWRMVRLVIGSIGLWLILGAVIPAVLAFQGKPPIGSLAPLADLVEPETAAWWPLSMGVVLLVIARWTAYLRLRPVEEPGGDQGWT